MDMDAPDARYGYREFKHENALDPETLNLSMRTYLTHGSSCHGDDRGNSLASQFYGTVPEKSVYGLALGVFWRSGEGPVWRDLD